MQTKEGLKVSDTASGVGEHAPAAQDAPASAGEKFVRSRAGKADSGKGAQKRSSSGGSRRASSSKAVRKPGPVDKYLRPHADRFRELFFSDSPLAALLWFGAAFGLILVLLWFFFVSPWGTPALPLYADF